MKCPECGKTMNLADLGTDQLFICKCGFMRSLAYMNGYWEGYEKGKNEKKVRKVRKFK